MLNIRIKTVPHSKQRYDTIGDYFDKKGVEYVLVSKQKFKTYEFLTAIHELVEKKWCESNGVSEKAVTAFDIRFEDIRKKRLKTLSTRFDGMAAAEYRQVAAAEPGDDPQAPYYRGHQIATHVERTVAFLLNVDWADYEDSAAEG